MDGLVGNLIYGLIGSLLGALATLAGVRFSYHDLFARTVSENRMDWINKFREEVSTIVAAMKMKRIDANADLSNMKTDNVLFQAEKAKASLITRLNQNFLKPGNEYNHLMEQALNKIDFNDPDSCSERQIAQLLDLSRDILEPEWKRVKEEAKGRRNG